MSFAGISSHWGASATLDDDSIMDIASDRGGDVDNNFLLPVPRTMAEDGLSTRSFDDEDMIDLSPRPSPRPSSPPLDVSIVDGDALEPSLDNTVTSHPTGPPANDMDEITFDDEEDGNVDAATDEPDKVQPLHQSNNAEEAVPADKTGTEEKYPELIDYGDEDDEIDLQASDNAVANETYQQQNEYSEQLGDPHLVVEDAESTEKVLETGDDKQPSSSHEVHSFEEHGNQTYDNHEGDNHIQEGVKDSTQDAENQAAEDQPKYSSHPIVVDYYNQWISLFEGSISELEDCFNLDEEVLYGNIALTFEHFRKSEFVEAKEWESLEIHVPALDLWVREKTDDADQYSFADLLNTYLDLHSHDGHYSPDPLFLTLTVRPAFQHQLEKLQRVAGNSEGFSKCDFLKSRQPAFHLAESISGDTGEETDEHPQQQQNDIDGSNGQEIPEQDSNQPSTYLSPTLSGQSGLSRELPQDHEQADELENKSELQRAEFEESYGIDTYDSKEDHPEEEHETGNQDYDEQGYNQDDQDEGNDHIDVHSQQGQEQELFEGDGSGIHETYEPEAVQEVDNEDDEAFGGDNDYDHGYDQLNEEPVEAPAEEPSEEPAEGHVKVTDEAPTEDANQEELYEDQGDVYEHGSHPVITETEAGNEVVYEEQHFPEDDDQSASNQNHAENQNVFNDDIDGEVDADGEAYDESYEHENTVEADGQEQEANGVDNPEEADDHEDNDADNASNDLSAPAEGDFLIDYSDDEEDPQVQAEETSQQVPIQEQTENPEDVISYSDDEDLQVRKTPTKRARSDDDVETEAKRVKS